jgi:D-arabinose 1-dehydrogenase-like Zn-dependent alcohol dehydrogenase
MALRGMADVYPPPLFFRYCIAQTDSRSVIDGEYATLRTEAVVRVPADVDPAAYAPILCAGITVFNGIRQMNITSGGVVAIQGLGGLGHLALQYSSKMGYRTVALSSGSAKEKFAKELGAHNYVDASSQNTVEELKKLGGADLIVATAPHPESVQPLVLGLAPRGKLLVLAREYPILLFGGGDIGWEGADYCFKLSVISRSILEL